MKKLLIVNQSANYLMVDIARAFIQSGNYDKVVLLVGNPKNLDITGLNNVVIDSICAYNRQSMSSRLKSWLKGFRDILKKIKKDYQDYELFLVSNPATVVFLPHFCKNEYYSLTYDLFPDGFLTSKHFSKNGLLFKFWAANNRKFFSNAKAVFCITEGMADAMGKYFPVEKIRVVPLWANENIEKIDVNKCDNIFLQKYNLTNRFIIQYSGNMGQGHSLDTLVDAASLLHKYKDICFLFIGEGWLKPYLQKQVAELGLEQSCLFLPYQPYEMLPYSFSCPDIAVVSLHDVSVSIPSKTFDIIRMGKPVICIADPKSSLSQFVSRNGFGKCFVKGEARAVADFILNAYQDSSFLDPYRDAANHCAANYTREKQTAKFLV